MTLKVVIKEEEFIKLILFGIKVIIALFSILNFLILKKERSFELRIVENKQKNKYDKSSIDLAHQTKKLINGYLIHLEMKTENIEYVDKDPDVKKYLKLEKD